MKTKSQVECHGPHKLRGFTAPFCVLTCVPGSRALKLHFPDFPADFWLGLPMGGTSGRLEDRKKQKCSFLLALEVSSASVGSCRFYQPTSQPLLFGCQLQPYRPNRSIWQLQQWHQWEVHQQQSLTAGVQMRMPLLPANTTSSASFGQSEGNSGFSFLLISELLRPSLFPPPVCLNFFCKQL